MRLTSFFHPQDLMRKPGFDDYNSGFPRLQIVCQNLTESDNSNPVLYSNETLSRKLFLPGVFVFPEEKPPYIARLLYETVTGLFHFCRLCRTIMKKEDYSMEKETIMIDGVRYYAAKKNSPCKGCCYAPCVSFCMKKCMNEVFKTKMEVPVNA